MSSEEFVKSVISRDKVFLNDLKMRARFIESKSDVEILADFTETIHFTTATHCF